VSAAIAAKAKAAFIAARARQLGLVAGEVRTPRQALASLRARYEKLTSAFLKEAGTTYDVWIEHGPKAALDELEAAARDDAAWDGLLERVSREKGTK
jgi:hypothetical protein